MDKHKTLIVAAIVMLVAATSAFGYHEQWSGWFSEGTLTYNGYDYVRNGTGGTVDDTSGTSYDYFYYDGNAFVVAFVCSALSDTIYLAVDSVSGSKVTGQTETKEGSGYWVGSAVRRKCPTPGIENEWDPIAGTWDTEESYEDFDYTTAPPSYQAGWDVYPTASLTGGGSSTGTRTHSD